MSVYPTWFGHSFNVFTAWLSKSFREQTSYHALKHLHTTSDVFVSLAGLWHRVSGVTWYLSPGAGRDASV